MAEPCEGQLVTSNIRLTRPLGAGGMGAVWLAEHLALHTQVVVKFISEDLAKSADAVARFKREAAAASQVKSPHVVQTLDHGVREDGMPFIVMEYLEGHDLAEHIEAHGKLPKEDVVAIVAQLGRALARAHERGIVHRDIKPSNVFLCDAGDGELFVKLLDFGIAKGGVMPKLDENTKTGAMVGSPHYMSPEQIVGDKGVDFHSDLWSLGVVAFEAMTGAKPFEADTVGGLALKIHNSPLPMPSSLNGDIPASVDSWFHKACARDPKGRFSGAKEMSDALAAAYSGTNLAPARSLAPTPLSQSSSRAIGFEKTAFDDQPPSMRSAGDLRSSTGVGVAARVEQPTRSRWALAAGALAIAAIVGFAGTRVLKGDKKTVATADSAPPSAVVLSAAPTTSTVPIALPPLPSISPSAITSASAPPRPSAHPVAKPTASAKIINPDDDIK